MEEEVKQTKRADVTESNKKNTEDERVFFGDSSEVNSVGKHDFSVLMRNTVRKQSLEGFDDCYVDIVDYIIRCTHRIWEEKGVGLIYTHYHNDAKVYTGTTLNKGIDVVISSTLQMLHAFPDRRVIGENVVWSGNDQDGFYSSHRITTVGTNLGDSIFGPVTGKKISFRVVADCVVHANRIYQEWLVRDNLYIVKQLGFDPVEVAQKLAKKRNVFPSVNSQLWLGESREGQYAPQTYTPKSDKFNIGDFVLELYNKIYEWKLLDQVKRFYAENAVVHYVCDKDLNGHSQIQGMLTSLFASFPNACFLVERVTYNQRATGDGWDVAVRWRLSGLHEGIGYFGEPSGKPVEILGVSHLKVVNNKVVEEWMVFDGLDVLTQIYRDITEAE